LYKHEELYLKKSNNKKVEIANWVKNLAKFPNSEFGDRYINSKAIKKYIGNGRWQDIIGVLDFDSKSNMQLAYKYKWQELNTEISQHLSIQDGEIDPDSLAEVLQNGNTPELKDLHSRIDVLEWAYKYVNLIYQ
jgi:hypothetical protein